MAARQGYVDREYERDGLRLYARDYTHAQPRGTLLCLPGTFANSADFDLVAERFGGDYRLVVPDLRGRGRSEWRELPGQPLQLLDLLDVLTLWGALGLDRVIVIGTSLSGWTAMGIASAVAGHSMGPAIDSVRDSLRIDPGAIRGVVMNDIGPEFPASGLPDPESHRKSVAPVRSWEEATAQVREFGASEAPDYSDADWERVARARYRENEDGVPVLAHHPGLMPPPPEPGPEAPGMPDVWPLFELLGDIPALVLRGALSKMLTADCVEQMQKRKPDLEAAVIPERGHCPNLDEPASVAVLETFFARVL